MSTASYQQNDKNNNTLYKSGRITATLNFNLASHAFRSLLDIDLTKLTQRKLNIFVFGQVNDDFEGLIPPSEGFVAQPNVTAPFYVSTARMDCGYQLVNGILSIGAVNRNSSTTTVSAPFTTGTIDFYIFYY